MISPAVFVLALEQIKRGTTATSLCSLLAAAGSEVAFGSEPVDGNSGRHFPPARRPT